MISWQELAERTKADWVGGQLIGMVNNKHVHLANLSANGLEVSFTLEGHTIAEGMDPLDRDADSKPGGSRKKRTPKAGDGIPADPNQLSLALDDAVQTPDLAG